MDLKIIISILLISYTINISSLSLEESISYAYNHRSELLMQDELAPVGASLTSELKISEAKYSVSWFKPVA